MGDLRRLEEQLFILKKNGEIPKSECTEKEYYDIKSLLEAIGIHTLAEHEGDRYILVKKKMPAIQARKTK